MADLAPSLRFGVPLPSTMGTALLEMFGILEYEKIVDNGDVDGMFSCDHADLRDESRSISRLV